MFHLGLEYVKCAVQVCMLVYMLATLSEQLSVATKAEHLTYMLCAWTASVSIETHVQSHNLSTKATKCLGK